MKTSSTPPSSPTSSNSCDDTSGSGDDVWWLTIHQEDRLTIRISMDRNYLAMRQLMAKGIVLCPVMTLWAHKNNDMLGSSRPTVTWTEYIEDIVQRVKQHQPSAKWCAGLLKRTTVSY